jgi:hypothetical protein
VEVSLLPMRLAGADGAPVRAVARVRPGVITLPAETADLRRAP